MLKLIKNRKKHYYLLIFEPSWITYGLSWTVRRRLVYVENFQYENKHFMSKLTEKFDMKTSIENLRT